MKKENVNKIFQSIGYKYDLMNDLMSFGLHRKWKRKFVDLIDLNLKKKKHYFRFRMWYWRYYFSN